MILYDKNGRKWTAIKCRKPKFRDYAGRTWDWLADVVIDRIDVEGYADTSWGHWLYFAYQGNWYKLPVGVEDESINHTVFLTKTKITREKACT